MLGKLSRGLDYAENALAFFGGCLLIFATFSVALEVISRYAFNHSFMWVDEINEYILLYIPFTGAAWLHRHKGHVSVDIFESMEFPRMHKVMDLLIAAVGMGICAVLVWYGTTTTIDIFERDIRSLTTLEIPQVYVDIIIPVGSLLLLFEFARSFYRTSLNRH